MSPHTLQLGSTDTTRDGLVLDHAPRARRASVITPSAVREILKVADAPDVISFAGGLPAPESFPVEEMARAFADTFAEDGQRALQYSVTEGHPPLRAWIAARLASRGAIVGADDLLITQGAQQAIDLLAKVMLDPGDSVLVETPSYLAALQVFTAAEVKAIALPEDHDGIRLDALEHAIVTHRPKLLYVMSDFRNPTGTSLSIERRTAILDICVRHGLPIVEDDPYGELRFSGQRPPTMFELDRHGAVVYLSTFSKTLAPGVRLGWVAARGTLRQALTVAKQATDLHSPTLNQRAVMKLLERFDFDAHLAKVRKLYASRAGAMDDALREFMPKSVHWHRPDGGLFFWVEVPEDVNVGKLFERALASKVAFVPGFVFFSGRPNAPFLRLNFSHRPEATIREGVKRLELALVELMSS
ncbi:PLP-dependent aminotransferase family protein [Myxococcota bacterium]|nr:PLP-dependent aminotransferase family protein [Myxococcota bacterium]